MKTNLRQHLLASTLLFSATLIATPAFAQDGSPQSPVPDQNEATNPGEAPPTGPVEGQPVEPTSATGEPVEGPQDIVVTGSRIPQPNLESASPVAVVTNQDIKLSGVTRVEDAIAQLPGATASQSSGISNGATGTAEIDLRFLGAQRTLTLVNGRRLTPGDPNGATQAGDINLIPGSLLKRVEVLTGGASSVYGADAVAGVVNFIMDDTFTGIRLDGQYGFYQHNNECPGIGLGRTVCDALEEKNFPFPTGSVTDGAQFEGTASIGVGFDDGRGHAVGYFGYRKVKPVLQADRDYSACALGAGDDPGENVICSGSGTSAEGNFFTSVYKFFGIGPNGTLTAPTTYNFAPLNYFQRPDERYTAGVFANYEVSPALNPYLEFMFMDDRTLAQIAPSGNFFATSTLNCDNPLLKGQARATICAPGNLVTGFLGTYPSTNDAPVGNFTGNEPPLQLVGPDGTPYTLGFALVGRRNVEGGPRISDLKHTSYRGVLGLRGDLTNVFSYDAYYQYGATNYSQVYQNEFSISRLGLALDIIDDPRTPGVVDPICRAALSGNTACVPYNLFGAPSQAAIDYLNIFGVIDGRTSQQIANVNFTGVLGEMGFRTPWASDGFGINVGAEYRKEKLELNPDQSFQTGDLAGQGAPTLPVDGSFDVKEVFGEVQLPIVQRTLFDELTIGAGYRKSWYETSNGREYDTDTYKLSAEFAPIRDVRFRGAYNRAVRAPNIQELFAPQFVGLSGSTDPCAGFTIQADDFGCIAQGLAPGSFTPENPAEQYNALLGGNPDLTPEKATTTTLGVVLQPSFVPRLAVTVDYFNIDLRRAIQGFGPDAILANCVDNTTATFTAPSCALVNRDPGGSIFLTPGGFVQDLPNNTGGIETSGIDIGASYSMPFFGLGQFSASFLGTYLREYIFDNGLLNAQSESDPYDCAGFYGGICSSGNVSSSSPLPKWRHKLRTTLQLPFGLGVSVQWRHIGKVTHERLSKEDFAAGKDPQTIGRRLKPHNYFDLAATYTLMERINLRAGVNNIFDNDPPLVSSAAGSCPAGPCNGNTYPGMYDALGRYFYAGATIDFMRPRRVAPIYIAPPAPPPPAPATQVCPDGSVVLATDICPAPPPPPPPPPPAPERG